MKIGGLQRCSLIDYPGRICAIVFTQGCNFRCPYCHNPELVDPTQDGPLMVDQVMPFLAKRRGKLDAVTVSGGEPTLQQGDIEPFLQEIRDMGYLVKIDTNGSLPEVLERLLTNRLVDYVAMDVKAPLEKYRLIAGVDVDPRRIRESIRMILKAGVAHEFRTTVVRSGFETSDLEEIAALLTGARLYVLQPFVPTKALDPRLLSEQPCPRDFMTAFIRSREGKGPPTILR
jgi:pyruvate formate lyase activating enzyme